MSRGIGRTQQTILNTLAAWPKDPVWLTTQCPSVMELAGALGLRDNQVRRAVRSLEVRGLVRVGKDGGNLYVRLITARDRRVDLAVAAAKAKDRALVG